MKCNGDMYIYAGMAFGSIINLILITILKSMNGKKINGDLLCAIYLLLSFWFFLFLGAAYSN
nr:MAG TPA: hypothetical protein [Caudoviricetes sp.]